MSRKLRTVAVAAIGTVALLLTMGPPNVSTKFDRALREWMNGHPSGTARALIQLRPGASAGVRADLDRIAGARILGTAGPNFLVAELSSTALRAVAGNPSITRISSDALVASFSTSYLANDVLLNTEALLPRRYTGDHIGVAVIDSGILPNANLKVTATYDFVAKNGAKVGALDPYGHGTHVSGLVASSGTTSSDLYQSIAPGVKLYALRALDQNGSGYTSAVINAVNFAVANKNKLGIDIINMSLGHPIYESAANDPLVQTVENAVAAGLVVVVSAGNFGGDPATHVTGYGGITCPGNAPDAITVGAIEINNTISRGGDTIPWYSSRGPTWYDGFQKPDLVAPGSHLVSDVPTSSTIARNYPAGLIKTSGTTNLTKLSGTSMSAGVVTGTVALMLEASRQNFPGARLTPNAIKAILQYTSLPMADYDLLTQGAGALNAGGAVALAAAIDPNQPVGSSWLVSGVNTWTTIGSETFAWGQRVVWGDRVIWGNQVYNNDPAWALRVVWGDRVVWGNRVVWGDSTVWDNGNPAVWGSRVVWGDTLLGQANGSSVSWGSLSTNVSADRVVWGDLSSLAIAPASVSWSNLERANGDLVQR
jgi:serine protease AprX